MSVWQWIGLLLFIVAMYFMVSPTKEKEKKTTTNITTKTIVMLVVTLLAGGGTMVAQKAFAKIVPNGNVATYSFLMFALNAIILYACYAGSIFLGRKKSGVSQTQEIARRSELHQGFISARKSEIFTD